jgi:hypothetical protein
MPMSLAQWATLGAGSADGRESGGLNVHAMATAPRLELTAAVTISAVLTMDAVALGSCLTE